MGISRGYAFEPNGCPPHPSLPDFKSNVLVDNNGHACLTGFSLLMMASDRLTGTFSFREGGTIRYMSPERLNPEKFGLQERRPTKESDCYALGMVVYEVLSGRRPFFTTDGIFQVMWKIMKGEHPERPQGEKGKPFTDDIWGTLELCWKPQPRDRISTGAVLLRLEGHPPLLRPSSNVDEDAEIGSDGQWESGSDDYSHLFYRLFAHPGMFSLRLTLGDLQLPLRYNRTASCIWFQHG
jgi:serine/threonine protein kinase